MISCFTLKIFSYFISFQCNDLLDEKCDHLFRKNKPLNAGVTEQAERKRYLFQDIFSYTTSTTIVQKGWKNNDY